MGVPSEHELDFPTVFSAIDIPALILDAEGSVVVWNEPLEELLGVRRADLDGIDTLGETLYEDRELFLAEKVLRHPQDADEVYDVWIADSEYALLGTDESPTYEDTSTADKTSGENLWFLATPLYRGETLVGVIEFVQRRGDSERQRREMERLVDELDETLSAFQAGDFSARAEYDFAESIIDKEDRELLEQVNDLAQMREALQSQVEETKATKRTLERRNEQLKRQNEYLDQFTSMISHDLRNPLNVAQVRTDLIVKQGGLEHAEDVRQALDRMETMIDELLTMARTGGELEPTENVRLDAVAEEAWQTVKTASVSLTLPNGPVTIEADRNRLLHVFENLFRNSIDHNEPPLTLRVGPLDSGAGFFVEDSGGGIPDDERAEIFDRGYTTSDDGTGFGLSIVRDIVDAHGWTITVTDSSMGGARFEIRTQTIED